MAEYLKVTPGELIYNPKEQENPKAEKIAKDLSWLSDEDLEVVDIIVQKLLNN